MKIEKQLLKYIFIFLTLLLLLTILLIATAKIPKKLILNNVQESAKYLKSKEGIQRIQNKREYTYLHTYADAIILNIIFCIDSNNPVESVFEAKYYERVKMDTNIDFILAVENNEQGNQEYLRYWHGSMSILRPLLILFNIEQIYYIFTVILLLLLTILILILWKKYKTLAIITFISMVMTNIFIVSFCLEYFWTILIMLIVSILSIEIEKNGNKDLYLIYFITGILTCYFDFLTTETLTILLPVLLVLIIRYKENRIINFRETLTFLLYAGTIWFTGYVLMWLAKWLLASAILNLNWIEYVKDEALLRINGRMERISILEMYIGAITKNIYTLFPINIIKRKQKLILLILIVIIMISYFIDRKKVKNKFLMLLILLGIMPYIRYILLANHSYRHYFFTYRAQLVSIIVFIFIIIYTVDESKIEKIRETLKKEIKFNNIFKDRKK